MKNLHYGAALAAMFSTLAAPALAAEDYRPPEMGQQRTLSAYAGGTLRLAMGKHERAVPRAALTMGFMQKSGSAGTAAPVRHRVVEALSFGGSANSRGQLSIAGVPMQEFDRKLGMSTLGGVAIGAVLGVGVLVAVAMAAGPKIPDDTVTGL